MVDPVSLAERAPKSAIAARRRRRRRYMHARMNVLARRVSRARIRRRPRIVTTMTIIAGTNSREATRTRARTSRRNDQGESDTKIALGLRRISFQLTKVGMLLMSVNNIAE